MINEMIIMTVSFLIAQITFVVITVKVFTNKRFIKWYYKKIMSTMSMIQDFEYEEYENGE